MAARVGTCAHASLAAAQMFRVREAWPDAWRSTGRVQVASAFLASLVCGGLVPISEAEACATGFWVHSQAGGTSVPQTVGTGSQGHWDELVLEIVSGNREEARRVRGWLGEVDLSGGRRRIGTVSRYLVDRYGFDPGTYIMRNIVIRQWTKFQLGVDTIVTPFSSDYLATYLSLCPTPSDAVLSFGPMDVMLAPAASYVPTRFYNLFPHPAQDTNEKRRYVAMLVSRCVPFHY